MPEIRFQIQWPDGSQETCYSPSLVVKDYFTPATTYPLADFAARSRSALTIASDRVQAKYGMPCGLALGQLALRPPLAAMRCWLSRGSPGSIFWSRRAHQTILRNLRRIWEKSLTKVSPGRNIEIAHLKGVPPRGL